VFGGAADEPMHVQSYSSWIFLGVCLGRPVAMAPSGSGLHRREGLSRSADVDSAEQRNLRGSIIPRVVGTKEGEHEKSAGVEQAFSYDFICNVRPFGSHDPQGRAGRAGSLWPRRRKHQLGGVAEPQQAKRSRHDPVIGSALVRKRIQERLGAFRVEEQEAGDLVHDLDRTLFVPPASLDV
jgi:hypothetical protein